MKLKKFMAAATVVASVALLAACGSKKSSSDNKQVKVGVLQLINQTALDDARKGFNAELAKKGYKPGKNVKIDYVNAQGDQANLSTMSQQLKKDKNDVNFAIATPAAQALQKADPDTPMVFTAVTDPKSAGLVSNLNAPDKNATGVTDKVDAKAQIELLHKMFPKAKKIGLIYNAAEPNSVVQIKTARKILKSMGLTPVEKTIASTNDAEQTMTALADKADAVYIPTDNTAAAAMNTIGKVSEQKKVPVVTADATMIKLAGVATKGFHYQDLGKQAADQVVKILKGKKVKSLPVENPAKSVLVKDDKRVKLFKVDPSVLK
ncbi:ABC transporter substrate-binding protein [Lacticaseibacillus pabuli]|uniref:ABC transporter substrate-binding protein n=1 Tax=Lacticaseibacillus pabuli TaxID=3025672 RepID=A0ABY7WU98_9LACO|nr:ABC transporter substrate-binding protein [Lacticaseibacillus sp. KACC 23028]WDF83033.1 ABC transporter substrate-binding protein [Lacticaseibacillus sp. KACC 23028]